LAKISKTWPIFKLFSSFFTFFRPWNTPETVLEWLHSKNEIFQERGPIYFLISSESACSGVFKISYRFFMRALLGQQVPQHDVQNLYFVIKSLKVSQKVNNLLSSKLLQLWRHSGMLRSPHTWPWGGGIFDPPNIFFNQCSLLRNLWQVKNCKSRIASQALQVKNCKSRIFSRG
jgi:hypothetical protein